MITMRFSCRQIPIKGTGNGNSRAPRLVQEYEGLFPQTYLVGALSERPPLLNHLLHQYNPGLVLDFKRWSSQSVEEYVAFQRDLIRSVIPGARVTTNTWFCERQTVRGHPLGRHSGSGRRRGHRRLCRSVLRRQPGDHPEPLRRGHRLLRGHAGQRRHERMPGTAASSRFPPTGCACPNGAMRNSEGADAI